MASEDALAADARPSERTVRPVVFFDRGDLPEGMKDFRPKKAGVVRPTVPPMEDEEPVVESLVPTAATLEQTPDPATEPPQPTLFDPTETAKATHPSRLPAKD